MAYQHNDEETSQAELSGVAPFGVPLRSVRPTTLGALVLLAFALPAFADGAGNAVVNGDFSQESEKGAPIGWEACGNARNVDQRLELGDDNGTHFARLVCTRCDTADASSHAMLAQVRK